MLRIVSRIRTVVPDFSLHTVSRADVAGYRHLLSPDEELLLAGTINNGDLLSQALPLLESDQLDHARFGRLLTEHHRNLRDAQRISTTKIDRMLDAALEAGALGGKINGSGGASSRMEKKYGRPGRGGAIRDSLTPFDLVKYTAAFGASEHLTELHDLWPR